jgi:hypothetical protein
MFLAAKRHPQPRQMFVMATFRQAKRGCSIASSAAHEMARRSAGKQRAGERQRHRPAAVKYHGQPRFQETGQTNTVDSHLCRYTQENFVINHRYKRAPSGIRHRPRHPNTQLVRRPTVKPPKRPVLCLPRRAARTKPRTSHERTQGLANPDAPTGPPTHSHPTGLPP